MIAFLKKFWKWILAGAIALLAGVLAWQIQRMRKKIKVLELDKFVLETEAKRVLKNTEIAYNRELADSLRLEASRLLSAASERGIEAQKLEVELQDKLKKADGLKDWDSLEKAAKGDK